MPSQQAVRVARPRGEVDPMLVGRIKRLQRVATDTQDELERVVRNALDAGASLNELARQTGIAKTTLLRWAKR